MLLSIIIVNYNVKYFLEQCLYSVEAALQTGGMPIDPKGGSLEGRSREGHSPDWSETEVFVVDNHSSDGSAEWLPARFPRVQFIVNKENRGFGAANNQALVKAKGRYILFLNPDTILPEDGLSIAISFLESTPQAGAAGIRMVDGSGCFLKESRRGFPSPWVAFCKLSGLTAIFPHSSLFANYYLGPLPENQTHPAPVLSGACLFVRKQALEGTGGFDERFFMYAEDIDLSYRIEQAGFTNYYIAGTTILHFKGESTPKNARHTQLFYKAMSQFRRKHARGAASVIFNSLLDIAIWGKAALTSIANAFRKKSKTGETTMHRVWVTGDPTETARLSILLSSRDRIILSDPEQADEIIFCEGSGFSFKQVITAIQDNGRRAAGMIHAAGSSSAIGSHSKGGKGDIILL
jgi:N-acetylglucosaminyl-diphospho-decaprenol L-rhamnosyltransferase